MPELPEVETLRRGLTDTVLGKYVETVQVLWRPSFDASRSEIERLTGTSINSVRRRGKALILDLDRGLHLLLHPMMTGQLVVVEHGVCRSSPAAIRRAACWPRCRTGPRGVVIGLRADTVVFLNDQRKFGWIRLLDSTALQTDPFLARLGPEPLSAGFTVNGFRDRLAAHPRAAIKAVLLDQSTVVGLGNIYADESLHLGRINPRRLRGSLSTSETDRLYAAIRTVLGAAVDHGGTSFEQGVNTFRGSDDHLASAGVFRRGRTPCPVRRDHRTNPGCRPRHELLPAMPARSVKGGSGLIRERLTLDG